MTNEEMLLRALTGTPLAENVTFQPQNNKQAYLAYALGLLTDADALPEPRTIEEALLKVLCTSGGSGGALPTLTNPAAAEQILKGYQAIDGDGNVITGEMVDRAGEPIESDALELELETAKVGTIYKYVGATTDTFENGALYIVEEAT